MDTLGGVAPRAGRFAVGLPPRGTKLARDAAGDAVEVLARALEGRPDWLAGERHEAHPHDEGHALGVGGQGDGTRGPQLAQQIIVHSKKGVVEEES